MFERYFGGQRSVLTAAAVAWVVASVQVGEAVASDPDGNGTGFAQCVIVVEPSGTQFVNDAEFAAAEWEWAMPPVANVVFVPPQPSYPDPDIWFYDEGAELVGADIIGAVYKSPPDATTYINFAIVYLNKYYVTGNRYYTGDACPPRIGGLDRYHVRTIFKHEFGHALGLTHADGGIMGLIDGHCDRRPNVDRGSTAYARMASNGLGSCEPLS